METSRFFVANLPSNTKESDLRNIFQDYGAIQNIELKNKENLVDSTDVKVIAFVTLNIGQDDAKYCLNDLNWYKVNGQQIKVSLAKESFLERLKREREDANKSSSVGTQAQVYEKPEDEQSELLKAPKHNKRKTFDVDAELDDDDVAIELMITKKRAASSMHNGRIVIQSQDVEPIHIIEGTKKRKNQLDDKSSSADQKRKESLNKMKNQYQQKKSAIQEALQSMDTNKKVSNKIRFSDAESESEEQKVEEPVQKVKTNIFGSDDEDDGNIEFKTLPSGKKGERLVQMQAKQSLDPRFRIDAKFVDDDEDGEENDQTNDKGKIGEDDERQWQMNILEQVVGTKLDTVKNSDKSHKNKKMLRYDPSKDEHQKFERTKEDESKLKKPKQKQSKTQETSNADAPQEVSKEVFYVVTNTLQESLRKRGEGFSLLNMFGNNDQLEQRGEQLKQLGNEKILVNNKLKKTFDPNPFTYDSSSESETEEQQEPENSVSKSNEKAAPPKSKNKLKISRESFFIPKNDIRLKEGSKFFIYKKSDDATTESYEGVRNRLKLIIKSKITKTKRSLANAGYKIKRRV